MYQKFFEQARTMRKKGCNIAILEFDIPTAKGRQIRPNLHNSGDVYKIEVSSNIGRTVINASELPVIPESRYCTMGTYSRRTIVEV